MSQHIDSLAATFVAVPGGRVIVGYDGSSPAVAALEWGAAEAVARSSSLRIVTCSAPSDATDFYAVGNRRRTELEGAAASVADRHAGLRVEQVLTVADPRDALMADAEPADVLVVGASAGSAVKRLLMGSVPRTAARRSPCPVVVVHDSTDDEPQPRTAINRIVIGVDGSSASDTAIQWACTESGFHGADVLVVYAWESGPREDAQAVVDRAVTRCRTLTPNPVDGLLIAGAPIEALVTASRGADLVAIGSRGRTGFTTMLFGSVALAVAGQSACPVAITHPGIKAVHDRNQS